ncbi:MAG: hypothetical protein MK100_00020 [Phycisphaerales bacterium]|nr:hypothetical protein [Phycisphaerales bacterium]
MLNLGATNRSLASWRWGFLLCMVVITTLTHWPTMDPLGPEHGAPDKLAHFLAFGIAAALLERSRWLPRGWWAFCIMGIWVPIDEWTQQWLAVSRDATLSDILSGLIGVGTAAIVTAALRPPEHATSHWTAAIRTLDKLAMPGGGVILSSFVGIATMAIAFPAIFATLWRGFGWSMPRLAAVLTLVIGAGCALPMLARSWRRAGGPSLPRLDPMGGALILLNMVGGWALASLLAIVGIPGLGIPSTIAGGIIGASFVMRQSWQRQVTGND